MQPMKPSTADSPALMTISQAADALGTSVTNARSWADNGTLPSIRTAGGHRRFRRSDVDALLAPTPNTAEAAS